MPPRIILLTECGAEIGFGHLSRCTAIARAFREVEVEMELWISVRGLGRPALPEGSRIVDWHDLPGETAAELARAGGVVVDSYLITQPQLDRIAATNAALAIIDDWKRWPHRSGVVIDWTLGAEKFAYPERMPGVQYLLGSRYCALRPEFELSVPRIFPEEPRSVLVTFGGADVRQLTAPVVAMLQREFPRLARRVVVGAGVGDAGFVERLRDERTTFHFACGAAEMCALMAETDLAICAGGQTLYELAALGLPPVVAQVVDNQTDDVREFAACGFALVAGDWRAAGLVGRIADGVRALWPAPARRRRADAGRTAVDGQGTARIVHACLAHWHATLAAV